MVNFGLLLGRLSRKCRINAGVLSQCVNTVQLLSRNDWTTQAMHMEHAVGFGSLVFVGVVGAGGLWRIVEGWSALLRVVGC